MYEKQQIHCQLENSFKGLLITKRKRNKERKRKKKKERKKFLQNVSHMVCAAHRDRKLHINYRTRLR